MLTCAPASGMGKKEGGCGLGGVEVSGRLSLLWMIWAMAGACAFDSSSDFVTPVPPVTAPAPVPVPGCADGTREGFVSALDFPSIAGCSGSWDQPGLMPDAETHCERRAGNDGAQADGVGCGAEDLCEAGWHVCASADEVGLMSASGCLGAAPSDGLFFATAQSGPGQAQCADVGNNDIFGCGSLGAEPPDCGPLDRFGHDLCSMLNDAWDCGVDGQAERIAVRKTESGGGGVLCCKD